MTEDNTDDGYSVGYRHPPVKNRFQKGQSGNPKGRPKANSKSVHELFSRELNRKVDIVEDGKKRKVTKIEVAIKRLINNALKGDAAAWATLVKIVPEMEKKLPPRKVTTQYIFSWADHDEPAAKGQNLDKSQKPKPPPPSAELPRQSIPQRKYKYARCVPPQST